MARRSPQATDGDSFLAVVRAAFAKRRAELADEVMAGLEDHGRYRAAAGRAAGIVEADEILVECWKQFGREDDDEG